MRTFAFALIAAFLGVQVFSLTMDDIKEKIKTCNKESGVKEQVVKDVVEKGIIADDPQLKADMFCFFKAIKVMDEQGNLNQGKLLEYFKVDRTDEQAQELVQNCGNKKKTPEDTAVEIIRCKIAYDKEHKIVRDFSR